MRKPQGKRKEVRKKEKNFLLCKRIFGEEAGKKRKEKKRKQGISLVRKEICLFRFSISVLTVPYLYVINLLVL